MRITISCLALGIFSFSVLQEASAAETKFLQKPAVAAPRNCTEAMETVNALEKAYNDALMTEAHAFIERINGLDEEYALYVLGSSFFTHAQLADFIGYKVVPDVGLCEFGLCPFGHISIAHAFGFADEAGLNAHFHYLVVMRLELSDALRAAKPLCKPLDPSLETLSR